MKDEMNKRRRIVINADDCGMNAVVNAHIETAIQAGRITSTTVMANMDDFEGAVALYKNYHDRISFGWHINLTEGHPLRYSQLLIEKGFYKETENGIEMDGRRFMHRWLSADARREIRMELMTQYEKLRDNGINISHIDSHHHVHTSVWAVGLIPSVLRETGVRAMRCMFNNKPMSLDAFIRRCWAGMMKMQVPGLKMPDVQCGFEMFANEGIMAKGNVIELECHPGHPNFEHEEKLLMQSSLNDEYQLVNYCHF